MAAPSTTAPRFVAEPRTKRSLHWHLVEMHGRIWPDRPSGWSHDEVLAAHAEGHRDGGPTTVAHTHLAVTG